ncbi:hypothetical protein DPMN_106631 [Dreissena polymorpha]|uniref:Uncharacterized protein n=1 Tax=Dreissena polymorpha TaxID=45954 RepID=A0A9D4QJZ3_DREPO|nr:hypothetical protein DPMN_106631 [Dreissena polymorpha]
MLKLAQTNQPTNRPTNQKTNQQTGQKQYVPHYYNINKTNVFTNFHDDWAKIVTSTIQIVFTCFLYIQIEKTAPPTGGHVFSPIWTIFELFHDDWAKNVTS